MKLSYTAEEISARAAMIYMKKLVDPSTPERLFEENELIELMELMYIQPKDAIRFFSQLNQEIVRQMAKSGFDNGEIVLALSYVYHQAISSSLTAITVGREETGKLYSDLDFNRTEQLPDINDYFKNLDFKLPDMNRAL